MTHVTQLLDVDAAAAGHLTVKVERVVPRMPNDSAAEVRHHTQLSPGNFVNRVYLRSDQL